MEMSVVERIARETDIDTLEDLVSEHIEYAFYIFKFYAPFDYDDLEEYAEIDGFRITAKDGTLIEGKISDGVIHDVKMNGKAVDDKLFSAFVKNIWAAENAHT